MKKSRLFFITAFALTAFLPSVYATKYENVLMSQIRDKNCTRADYRKATYKIGSILAERIFEILPTEPVVIETPVASHIGEKLAGQVELVSVMRSGDALIDPFTNHFPDAAISKFLIQRDEETKEPRFIYMKPSPTLASGNTVIITEPMIGTGGTLKMTIGLLIKHGVKEENIIVASICGSAKGIDRIKQAFPQVRFICTAVDTVLTEAGWISPGLGDFGDRYFGTE